MEPLLLESLTSDTIPEKPGIYFIYTNKEFPRLHGSTNIVYIGRTKTSLLKRLKTFPEGFEAIKQKAEYKKRRAIKRFWNLQQAGFKLYYSFRETDDPIKEEQKEIAKFEAEHLELPPLNHSN